MPQDPADSLRRPQAGGVTIMVALLLLVLLTIAALGMSRNSFRDIVSTGFARQGGMAREVADSGAEWAMYWMDPANAPATPSAVALVNLETTLRQNTAMAGVSYNIITQQPYLPGAAVAADMTVTNPNNVAQGFTIGLTQMGQPHVTGTSQSTGQGDYSPASNQGTAGPQPILWAIRSDSQVTQGPVTFTHGQEIWITTPF